MPSSNSLLATPDPITLESIYIDGADTTEIPLEIIQIINPVRPRIPARGLEWVWGLQPDELKSHAELGSNDVKVHPTIAQLFRDGKWTLMPDFETLQCVASIIKYNSPVDVHNDTRKNIFKELCKSSYEYTLVPTDPSNFPYLIRSKSDDRCWTAGSPSTLPTVHAPIHPSLVVLHASYALISLPALLKSLRDRYTLLERSQWFMLQISPSKFGHLLSSPPSTSAVPSLSPPITKRKRKVIETSLTSLSTRDDEESFDDTDSCSESAYQAPRPKQPIRLPKSMRRRIETWQQNLDDSAFVHQRSPAKGTCEDFVCGRYAQEPCRDPSEIFSELDSLPRQWRAAKKRRITRRRATPW